MKQFLFSLCIASLSATAAANQPAAKAYDVVVYGGTSAGVIAAVKTAHMGKSVILIEPGKHLGGLTSGGLGMTDSGKTSVIGGMSREFYQRAKKHYDADAAWNWEKRAAYPHYRAGDDAIWRFEPSVAEQVYRDMIAEAKVPVVFGERLDLKNGVVKDGTQITSIMMESGKQFAGRVFIDASYEGDLMAKAGVTYTVGREANSKYGETLDGVQTRNARSHQFNRPVDPYVVPGDPSSGLLPGVHDGGPGEEGGGDHRVQAYCFRTCMTDVPENRVPFPKPEGYDPLRYEILLRYLTPGWNDIFGNHKMMPNRKTDTNNHGGFGSDNIGMNYDYPDGDYETRDKIIKEHETYQKGFYWFLVNDPRVPEPVRQRVGRWGLAKDEFTDNGNWPHQLYIREARRMVSDYVMTEHDCRRTRTTPESIGMGSYNMDSHNVQRYVDASGHVRNEGDVQVSPGGPYMISYQSIRPKRTECTNLLAPVCLCSSHIAYGSIRMEPVFMILGESAATAAVFAVGEGIAVQDVSYEKLRERLLADKQVLDIPAEYLSKAGVDPKKLPGIVVDDREAATTGTWSPSASVGPYVGVGYLHDGDAEKGRRAARFEAKLPAAGTYEVRLAYSANPNRATNVPVTIEHVGGTAEATVNQRKAPPIDDLFVSLGKFPFAADKPAVVIVKNDATDGHVILDAVQFIPATK